MILPNPVHLFFPQQHVRWAVQALGHIIAAQLEQAVVMGKPPHGERHTLVLLCVCIFLLVFGETMQPAPRTQIYEAIICDDLLPPEDSSPDRCKAAAVQEELVFLKGTERLLGAFPSELHTFSRSDCLAVLTNASFVALKPSLRSHILWLPIDSVVATS